MYIPTRGGLGMHVEVRDPDDSIVISRVRTADTSDGMLVISELVT